MSNKATDKLSDNLIKKLNGDCYGIVSTIDYETGAPNTHALSWIYAHDSHHVYLATGQKSQIAKNISQNKKMTMTFIVEGTTLSITGTAKVKVDELEDVSINLALVELTIKEVRDAMFFGGEIITEPVYTKTYNPSLIEKLDREILDAFKRA